MDPFLTGAVFGILSSQFFIFLTLQRIATALEKIAAADTAGHRDG